MLVDIDSEIAVQLTGPRLSPLDLPDFWSNCLLNNIEMAKAIMTCRSNISFDTYHRILTTSRSVGCWDSKTW